jgi:hypothetical protein
MELNNKAGPQQTDDWPLVWADLDPRNLPAWITWQRTCQHPATDGGPCPRRVTGWLFNVSHCDLHCPTDRRASSGQAVG